VKPQARLIVFGVLAIAAGLTAPWVPENIGRDLLAGVAVLGGLAMIMVALANWDDDWRDGRHSDR
jgi:hypothetical protein